MNHRRVFLLGAAIGLVIVLAAAIPVLVAEAVHPGLAQRGDFGDVGRLLFTLVFLAIISGAAWLVTWALTAGARSREPLAVLRQRYARGEVGQEDYVRIKETLSSEAD